MLLSGLLPTRAPIRRPIVRPIVILVLGVLYGCGGSGGETGGGGSPSQLVISTPNGTTELDIQETISLTANTSATWSIPFCENQPLGCGTLSSSTGTTVIYTPPQKLNAGGPTAVFVNATSAGMTASANLTVTPVPVVILTNKVATIQAGSGSVGFDAWIQGNTSSLGVTWRLSGVSCSGPGSPCGSLTPITGSDRGATYTAPSEAPTGNAQATITAISVEDPTSTDQFTFTIATAATVVTLSNTFNTVAAGGGPQTLTATVKHDVGAQGVTWALTAGSPPVTCQPLCGSLSQPTSNTIGLVTTATVTYSPPVGPPLPSAPDNAPTISANSVYDSTASASDVFTVQDFTCGSGSEAMLRGQYAFLLRGFYGAGNGTPFAVAGSFAADGTGKITAGEEDLNEYSRYQHLSIAAANSSYSVGADGRGCISIATTNGSITNYRFALGGVSGATASKGSIIESDDTTGTDSRASGVIRLQDITSFELSKLRSNYALGADGWDTGYGFPGHFAMAASCPVNNGNKSGVADVNDVVFIYVRWTIAGCSIGAVSTSTGRATGSFGTPVGANFIMYMINEDEFFIVSPSLPLYTGRVISTGNSFSLASVSGSYVLHCTEAYMGLSGQLTGRPILGLMNFDNGNLSGIAFTYFNSTLSNQIGFGGPTYTVDSTSGRLALGPFTDDAIYLTTVIDGISGFYINFSTGAGSGLIEGQPSANYSADSSAGNYMLGQDEPSQPSFTNLAAAVSISSAGSVSGTSDASAPSGLMPNQPFSLSLTINPDGTGNAGANTFAVVNGTKVFILQELSATDQITVLEER